MKRKSSSSKGSYRNGYKERTLARWEWKLSSIIVYYFKHTKMVLRKMSFADFKKCQNAWWICEQHFEMYRLKTKKISLKWKVVISHSHAIRKVLPDKVTFVLIELSPLFRQLWAKNISILVLDKIQSQYFHTINHLEILFPPTFFIIMVDWSSSRWSKTWGFSAVSMDVFFGKVNKISYYLLEFIL